MNRSLIFLFLISTLFLFGACQESADFDVSQLHSSLADAALKNPCAQQLQMLMDAQQGCYERLQGCLGENKAFFEGVKTESAYDFGPYYAIPYQNMDGLVKGCVIIPMDENVSDKEKRSFSGQLGAPVDLDEAYLYGKIPTERRALYSSSFVDWENMGLKVSSGLTQFSKELRDHTIQLSEDECNMLPQSRTRSSGAPFTQVWISYKLEGRSANGVAYALSISTFMNLVKEEFDCAMNSGSPFHVKYVDHCSYQTLCVSMYIINSYYYDRLKFESKVRYYLYEIEQKVKRMGYLVTMQFYYIMEDFPASVKPPSSGGGSVHTGSVSSDTGYSNPEGWKEQNKREFKLDCSQNANQQYADSVSAIMDKFESTNIDTYPNTMPYSEYLQKVHNDSVEYSTCFSSYPEDGINTFSHAIRGGIGIVSTTSCLLLPLPRFTIIPMAPLRLLGIYYLRQRMLVILNYLNTGRHSYIIKMTVVIMCFILKIRKKQGGFMRNISMNWMNRRIILGKMVKYQFF